MNIWNKILVWLIGIAALPLFILAMWTLKVHKYWAESAGQHERTIEKLCSENQNLEEGVLKDGELVQPGKRQVRLELYNLLLDRRRTWSQCDPKVIKLKRDDDTAEISLTIDQPVPHGITEKTVLYAFEEADAQQKKGQKRGQYLGEFKVSSVADKKVTLVPTTKLNAREIARLSELSKATIRGPWVLCETLPRDNHELFAGLSDEQLKAMLSADSLPEYLKHGKPAAPDDPRERIQGGKYVRQLRDYGVLLGAEQRARSLLSDSIEAAQKDKRLLSAALTSARQQEEACKKGIAAAAKELKKSTDQRDVVAGYRKKLEEKLAAWQAEAAKLIAINQAMAGQIAKFQLQAAERIDARTRVMAQSGTETR